MNTQSTQPTQTERTIRFCTISASLWGTVLFIAYYFGPSFKHVFQDFGVELSMATQLALIMCDLLVSSWFMLVPGILVLGCVLSWSERELYAALGRVELAPWVSLLLPVIFLLVLAMPIAQTYLRLMSELS